jgi:5-formyltetrahydrofolate cyclo-ligase
MVETISSLVARKQQHRKRIWQLLEQRCLSRFPGAWGRIPNFRGAERCVEQLQNIPAWRAARVVKCNPDSPQTAIRRRALEEGKTIYMAVPRLREERCFLKLDHRRISSPRQAASIRGASQYGEPVRAEEMEPIDLIVCGSVVVNRRGERLGKGGGYSDLEFVLAREAGLVSDSTPILTTVHPLQVVEDVLPWSPHDIPVDYIVTPEEVIPTEPAHSRPLGILWEFLQEEKIAAIPVQQSLAVKGNRK